MRVFVTGATGFIGSAVVRELVASGHQVLGLARSEAKAAALSAAGAEVQSGTLEDADALARAAAHCDGVIHLAFNHDFSRFAANCEEDRHIIATLGGALAGSARPLLVTSGTGIASSAPGTPSREEDGPLPAALHPRAASEEAAVALGAEGVNVGVVRLPQVHDTRRQGLVSFAIEMFRARGACAYVAAGEGVWPAAHVLDVARLYRRAIEAAVPGATYHAAAEEGVPLRRIAETLGARLGLPVQSIAPEEAPAWFGWLTPFVLHSMPASSARTRAALGWVPEGPGLLADLERLELPAA